MDNLPVQKYFVKKIILFPLSQVLDQNNEKMPKLEESNSTNERLLGLVMARGRCWTGTWKRALEITGFLVNQRFKLRDGCGQSKWKFKMVFAIRRRPPPPQWAKSGGEAVLLQFQISPRTLCTISTDCFAESPVTVSFDHILCTF